MSEKISRRTFVKSATLFGAATLVSTPDKLVSQVRQKVGPLPIGLMTWRLAQDWDIDTIIKNCTETGYEHVELRTTHAHGVELDLTPAQRREIKKRFEDSPLKAISLASAFQYHYDDPERVRENIEGTKAYIVLGHDLGALGVRVFPNALLVDKGIPQEQTLRQIGSALREVGEFSRNHGIEVRLEVHGRGTNYVPRVKKMIDYSESDHVFVLWNCDMNDTGGAGFEANFEMVSDKIRHVHMHELWNDEYPYRRLFELLKEAGYKGYCNAEIPPSPEPIRLMRYYRALFLAYQNAM